MFETFQSHVGKACVAAATLLMHAIALQLLSRSDTKLQPEAQGQRLSVTWVQVAELDRRDTTVLPEIQLVMPAQHLDALTELRFEDPDDEAGVVGAYSAPRLSRVQVVSPEVYARRAGITPHHPVTVVLAILVLEDGTVGEVRAVRSSGSEAIDAAAAEYARALHWIAGTQDRQPHSMRITFPVVLSVSG